MLQLKWDVVFLGKDEEGPAGLGEQVQEQLHHHCGSWDSPEEHKSAV